MKLFPCTRAKSLIKLVGEEKVIGILEEYPPFISVHVHYAINYFFL